MEPVRDPLRDREQVFFGAGTFHSVIRYLSLYGHRGVAGLLWPALSCALRPEGSAWA